MAPFDFTINLGSVLTIVVVGLVAWWAKSMKEDIHDVKLSNLRVENRLNDLATKVSQHDTSLEEGNQRFRDQRADLKALSDALASTSKELREGQAELTTQVMKILREGCSRVRGHDTRGGA